MAFTKNTKDPFSTPVGHLIEINTVGTVKDEDWGQFMNICDKINSSAEGPKDAVKALKKRISKNYNQKQVKLSLSLLEMCMQNCNANFQTLVLKKDFCKDVLVKLLNPKYNLPIDMQYRILRFIMTWATSPSRGDVDQVEVKELYLEMIKKGIQFPSLNPSEDEIRESHRTGASQSSDISSSKPFSEATGQNLTPEQIGKLYSELDMVRMNMKVMSAILLENYPGSEIPGDMELLEELQKTCQEMQARILKLLETVQNEEVIIELVHVNDDLNNLFLRYQRFSRTRGSQSLDNIRREDNSMSNNNDPSAPSSELIELDLKPINHYANGHPPPTTAASAAASAITPRLVHSSDPGSAQQSNFIYPQRDLLELREAVNMPFTLGGQIQVPSIPPRPLYDNVSGSWPLRFGQGRILASWPGGSPFPKVTSICAVNGSISIYSFSTKSNHCRSPNANTFTSSYTIFNAISPSYTIFNTISPSYTIFNTISPSYTTFNPFPSTYVLFNSIAATSGQFSPPHTYSLTPASCCPNAKSCCSSVDQQSLKYSGTNFRFSKFSEFMSDFIR
ncbi:TOM1-like protein 1 [Gastrophryne carolinensis]